MWSDIKFKVVGVKISRVRFSFLSRNHKFLLNWMASIINEASHELKYHLSPFLFQLPKKLQLLLSCTSCSWFITVHWSSISHRDWLWKKLYYSCFVTRFHQCFWSYQRIEKQLLRTKELLIFFDDQDKSQNLSRKDIFFFLHVWQDGCILIDKSALKIVRESVNFFRHGLIWISWTQNYIFSFCKATIIVCCLNFEIG